MSKIAKDEEDKLFGLINSLMDVKKCVLELLLGDISQEVKNHIQIARKEKLLALRAFIDSAINRLEKSEKEAKKKKPEK